MSEWADVGIYSCSHDDYDDVNEEDGLFINKVVSFINEKFLLLLCRKLLIVNSQRRMLPLDFKRSHET